MIYTYNHFGYESSLISVEAKTMAESGFDIAGLYESLIAETKGRVKSGIISSGLEMPDNMLVCLNPTDLKKTNDMSLAIAASVLRPDFKDDVLIMGSLDLSGDVIHVNGILAGLQCAESQGIRNAIIPAEYKVDGIKGIKIHRVRDLKGLIEAIDGIEKYKIESSATAENGINFPLESSMDYSDYKGYYDTIHAIMVAVAGKHHLLDINTVDVNYDVSTMMDMIPSVTPAMTYEESLVTSRIYSLAGLSDSIMDAPPFRVPHQTANIEGICGGGVSCRPGEISLAHNGVLFLDEAAEFRSSVLQMLRVPLESASITLSRAGRTTVYPAKFQLLMSAKTCPCGNYGSEKRLCLCSARSVEQYWKKFGTPLLDRIHIRIFSKKDESDERILSTAEMRKNIARAYEVQRKRGTYNAFLHPCDLHQIYEYLNLDFSKIADLSARNVANIQRVAVTLANIRSGTDTVIQEDVDEAIKLHHVIPLIEKA